MKGGGGKIKTASTTTVLVKRELDHGDRLGFFSVDFSLASKKLVTHQLQSKL